MSQPRAFAILAPVLLLFASSLACYPGRVLAVQAEQAAAAPTVAAARPFQWEIVVRNASTSEVRTYRTFDKTLIEVGSWGCHIAPQAPELAGDRTMQSVDLVCTAGDAKNFGVGASTASEPCVSARSMDLPFDGDAVLDLTLAIASGTERWTVTVHCLK